MIKWRVLEPTAMAVDLIATEVAGQPVGIFSAMGKMQPEQIDMLGTLQVLDGEQWVTVASMDETPLSFKERQRVRTVRLETILKGCDLAFAGELPIKFQNAMREMGTFKTGIVLPFSPVILSALGSGLCSYLDLRDKLYTRDAIYMAMLGMNNSISEWLSYDRINSQREVK